MSTLYILRKRALKSAPKKNAIAIIFSRNDGGFVTASGLFKNDGGGVLGLEVFMKRGGGFRKTMKLKSCIYI